MYFIFLFSIFLHEFGHLIMAKFLNVHIKNIKFKLFCISAEIEEEKNISNKKMILVIGIGPIINLLICIIFFKFDIVFNTNLLLFIFNNLPIIPLDGGKVFFYLINTKFDYLKSLKIILLVSKIMLITLSIFYCFAIFIIKNVIIFFVIFYLWIAFIREERKIDWYIKIYENLRNNGKKGKKYLQEE